MTNIGVPGGSAGEESAKRAGDPVQPLGREAPLEKGMATHSVFLSEESHGQRSPVGHRPRGCKESDTTE